MQNVIPKHIKEFKPARSKKEIVDRSPFTDPVLICSSEMVNTSDTLLKNKNKQANSKYNF